MVFSNLKSVFSVKHLRKKIIIVWLLLLVYEFLSIVPVPGVDKNALTRMLEWQEWLAFFGALMWWWLKNFSIILMWLSPYINASIIIQLLWVVFPKIWDLQKEWENGQRIINKWTRYLTLPLAFLQSFWMITLLNTLAQWDVLNVSDKKVLLLSMLIVTAWTMFLVWLWEKITEYGIWNGISLIITAWILSWVPVGIIKYFTMREYWLFALILTLTLVIIYVIIKFTEWNRRIPIIYSRTWREEKSYFPIRINQAWMIPIIFSVSIITFPWILWQILANNTNEKLKVIWTKLMEFFNMSNPSAIFLVSYFALIVLFSFFYISITFNTDEVADNIQKRWWYIPWIRPGKETSQYLTKVSNHLNLFGWSFLAIIAVLPYILWKLMNRSIDLIISWAWLIIIVSVILDLLSKLDSETKMFDYSKYK